ncbi:glycoside hydrolase family 30 protein [Siphonobacter aquaeclarae]|uniref:O-Glycosyl hydrolase n=1 Tax=Siphonobacter aquaeclarae TaxID=563176 RepID=A0A1G9Y5Z3_9BACT|nr:glycoside hydrolase family 30 protein [Siphonobacter aquaeclarae]SDN03981.1 O-Glycosyl hydrolase [Siphonobacter aquaeclarae]
MTLLPHSRRLLAALVLLASACRAGGSETPDRQPPLRLRIDPSKTYQTIEHFGASDAWSCQFIGTWPLARKNAIADLLFSRDTLADGRPKGIALSLWRFNIGAGTAEQGSGSGIGDEWRRTESFAVPGKGYDWNRQAGQVWFLEAARDRGVPSFLAFSNTPPVTLTVNGKGYATNGQANIREERFDAFATYLADVLDGIRTKTGIAIQYLSPFNEPQWDWSDGGQEGTPIFNDQLAPAVRKISAALLKRNSPTLISLPESAQINYIYSDFNRPGRGSQVQSFFTAASANYLGDLKNVDKAISGHSYFTTSPYAAAAQQRKTLAGAFPAGVRYWQSEYCVLGDNEGEINGNGRDLSMTSALYVARVIHNDLVNANASAWHWWLAVSPYDYKDGLVYVDKNKTDGQYYSSKLLWAMGNFSRFVRPGAVRVSVTDTDPADGLLVSSYRNTDNQLVTVLINSRPEAREVQLDQADRALAPVRVYETSETRDLAPVTVSAGGTLTLAPRSVVTVISRL